MAAMQDRAVESVVRIERDGDVGVIVIDNPPVNLGSLPVRRGILEAVKAIRCAPELVAGVLIGAGKCFVSGSDLQEFERTLEDPQWPEVIAAIEDADKPFVAALHGAAFGGGLELALGCDARVAATPTRLGLPEVTLGVIPGAGGTQRLPRLIGVVPALRLICGGEPVEAAQAVALGLIDEQVPEGLRDAAVRRARSMRGTRRRVRDLDASIDDEQELRKLLERYARPGGGRDAVLTAAQAVQWAARLPIAQGLERERAAFHELRRTPEAAALRHQFFAERRSLKHQDLRGVSPRALRRIGVVGSGTMGTGIAIAALDAGFEVVLVEQDAAALQRGVAGIAKWYSRRVQAGKMLPDAALERQSALHSSLDWADLGSVDLAVEATFEDLAVKREVFARLDAVLRPGALLASNTSYLDLDALAETTARAQDVIGLHFFSPAQVMRLLEVVRGSRSGAQALATGLEFGARLGKRTVVARNGFGFIGNRIYSAYRRQCEYMLEEGAGVVQIDQALESFGFAMGPFAVADLSGLDIAWRMRQARGGPPGLRYVAIPDLLCEAGRLGRKTGAGYYRYDDTGARHQDPEVEALVVAQRARAGVRSRPFESEEIQQRALTAMANEAALLLSEQVARNGSDVDVVMVNGFGFPRWRGGPVFHARGLGEAELRARIDRLAHHSGPGFVRGDESRLFQED